MAIAVIDSYKTSIYPSGRVIKELTDIETGKEIAKIECAGLSELLED